MNVAAESNPLLALDTLTDGECLAAANDILRDPSVFASARALMWSIVSDPKLSAPLFEFFHFGSEIEEVLVETLCEWINPHFEELLANSNWLNSPQVFSLALSDQQAARRAAALSVRVRAHLTSHSGRGIEHVGSLTDLPARLVEPLTDRSRADGDPTAIYALLMVIFWRALVTVWASNTASNGGLTMAERDILRELDQLVKETSRESAGPEVAVSDEQRSINTGHIDGIRALLAESRLSQVVASCTVGMWILLVLDSFIQAL